MTYSELTLQLQKIKRDEKLGNLLGNPKVSICVNAEIIVIKDVFYDHEEDIIIISDGSFDNTESVL